MDLEKRVAYGIMHIPANAFAQDKVEITQMRLTPDDDGWLVMLKGTRRGKRLVAFCHEGTWREALRTMTTMLDSGHAVWRVSKPPPWRR